MKSFDGRIGKKLPKQIVSDLRFFSFYIGNESLLLPINDLSVIYKKSNALGHVFAIKLFGNYDKYGKLGNYSEGKYSLKEMVLSLNKKESYELPAEMSNVQNDLNWRSVIVRFMLDFGNGKIDAEPVKKLRADYRSDIIDYGNSMEMLTTIFTNTLRMDNDFNVINEDWIRYRASQFIRSYHDETFRVIPSFKYWEQTLWL